MTYRVHVGGRRYRRFSTLDAAKAFCEQVFARTGIVLSITEAPRQRPGGTQTLPVIFRAQREAGVLWITAVFPTVLGTDDPGTFTAYQHIGQHGSATRAWYHRTRRATPAEYAPLLKELRAIYEHDRNGDGVYRLTVKQRMTRAHDSARRAEAEAYRRQLQGEDR